MLEIRSLSNLFFIELVIGQFIPSHSSIHELNYFNKIFLKNHLRFLYDPYIINLVLLTGEVVQVSLYLRYVLP